MEVTKSIVEHVANLARLNFSEEEKEKFGEDLGRILTYIDKLNQLDTSNVEPTAHVIPMHNVLRNDEVRKSLDREKILKNASSKEAGCFKVPRIVE